MRKRVNAGNRTVYVSAHDAAVWQEAEAYAQVHRIGIGRLFLLAVREYLDARRGANLPGINEGGK